jgi:transcriptional regulator with XRE-family HTH domain
MRLGEAVRRARLVAGFNSRSQFSDAAGVSKRAIDALESGEATVGRRILEQVGHTLGRYFDQWSIETAQIILEGGPPPPNRLRHEVAQTRPDSTRLQPVRYADMKDFLRAQITLLRRQGMSDELITATVRELLDEPDAKRR